ncbi:MAG: DinB family protein [Thermoanaerobaculia bacterium]
MELFRALGDDAWEQRGTASNNPVSVRALAYITVGHERHHLRVLRERYLAIAT